MALADQSNAATTAQSSSQRNDWTVGPAKHAAVMVLALAALIGASVSFRSAAPSWLDSRGAASATAASGPSGASLPNGRLDINRASAQELTLLPAIGPGLAARIVADREENGLFASVEDLRRVSGIGPRILAKVLPFAVVREDEAAAARGEREP